MAKINLQCNNLLQTHSSIFFEALKLSKLLDKQVNSNAQKEKSFRGSCKLLQAHEKVCDENETKKQKEERMMRM